MNSTHDIKTGRLSQRELAENFCDKLDPLDIAKATIEASRCYFCHDAPCIQACPTGIDIPSFIRKISTDNLKGAATDILSENIMGGTCARVCPVETLCEQACVRNKGEEKPVTIGQLQRYATDWLFENKVQPFKRQKSINKKVAVIGGGPAGLSCAHRLAFLGVEVEIFEEKQKSGGLNEYGLAQYKVINDWAQKEVSFITDLGGIKIHNGKALGQNLKLETLRKEFDAVFIGTGLSGVNAMKAEGENLPQVIDAVEYISRLRQSDDLTRLPVGRRVVVIGGGNTAIDISMQIKLLGAEDVTMVYRRGPETMTATWKEQELAQKTGILIKHWMRPAKIHGTKDGVTSMDFERTQMDKRGKLQGTGEFCSMPCDQVFKAIGQILIPQSLGDGAQLLEMTGGKIIVDENRKTTLDKVYAGGDCINGGSLTVTAVQDGKIAAHAIYKMFTGVEKWPI